MYQMALGYQELLLILFILLLLFGSSRLPELARGLGKSIREFKRGVSEGEAAGSENESVRREALRAPDGERLEDARSTASRAEKAR
jgi:sec-independent protein translocase protein TatA